MHIATTNEDALVFLNRHKCASTAQVIDVKSLSKSVLNSIIDILQGNKNMPASGVAKQISTLLIRGLQLPVMMVQNEQTYRGEKAMYFSYKNLPTDMNGLRPHDTVNKMVNAELAALRMHDDKYSHRRWGLVVPMPTSASGCLTYINAYEQFDKIRVACRRSNAIVQTIRTLNRRETIHVTYHTPK